MILPIHKFDVSQNTTVEQSAVEVVCAWALSGQYGPGARMLYYVLVVLCIFARKSNWMRSACLAAALLVPAVAAIHAIILVADAREDAVDMDIFGVLQLCAIGVLVAPTTVRYSATYFNSRGRSILFVWTVLNLAALISLIVGFFRAPSAIPCLDGSGNNVTYSELRGNPNICNQTCAGLITPIRKDPFNQSFWVTPPHRGMTFNTAILFSAACCVPAILNLFSMWQKVLLANYMKIWGKDKDKHKKEEQLLTIEEKEARLRDKRIRLGLGLVELLVIAVFIMAIVVLGELNFWSQEMRTGVEPITSVGQWGQIVAVALAGLGSAWTLIADPDLEDDHHQLLDDPKSSTWTHRDVPPHHHLHKHEKCEHECHVCRVCTVVVVDPSSSDQLGVATRGGDHDEQRGGVGMAYDVRRGSQEGDLEHVPNLPFQASALAPTTTSDETQTQTQQTQPVKQANPGARTTVSNAILRINRWLSTPDAELFTTDMTDRVGYRAYPRIPGEEERNDHLYEDEKKHKYIRKQKSQLSMRSAQDGEAGGSNAPTGYTPGESTLQVYTSADLRFSRGVNAPPRRNTSPSPSPLVTRPPRGGLGRLAITPIPPSPLSESPELERQPPRHGYTLSEPAAAAPPMLFVVPPDRSRSPSPAPRPFEPRTHSM